MTLKKFKHGRATGKLSLLTLALMAAPFAMADNLGWYGGPILARATPTLTRPASPAACWAAA